MRWRPRVSSAADLQSRQHNCNCRRCLSQLLSVNQWAGVTPRPTKTEENEDSHDVENDASEEEIEVATLIGLLHDIARFKQYTEYQTFKEEPFVREYLAAELEICRLVQQIYGAIDELVDIDMEME